MHSYISGRNKMEKKTKNTNCKTVSSTTQLEYLQCELIKRIAQLSSVDKKYLIRTSKRRNQVKGLIRKINKKILLFEQQIKQETEQHKKNEN